MLWARAWIALFKAVLQESQGGAGAASLSPAFILPGRQTLFG